MSLADFLQITPPPPRARSITPVHSFDDSMVDYLSAEVLLQQAFSIRAEVSLIRTEGRFGQKEGGSKARWGIRCTIRLTRNGSKKCLCHSGLSNPSPLSSSNGGRDIGRFGLKSDVVHRAFVCVGLFRGFSRFSQRKSCTRRPCRWHGAQLRARRVFKSKQMVCPHEAGRSLNVVKLNRRLLTPKTASDDLTVSAILAQDLPRATPPSDCGPRRTRQPPIPSVLSNNHASDSVGWRVNGR